MNLQLLSPVLLDAAMPAAEVLRRFAAQGLWLDPAHDAVRERIAPLADRLKRPPEQVLAQLARAVDKHAAAIRRQWGTRVLWYARPAAEVLHRCMQAPPGQPLLDVLNLHEADSVPALPLEDTSGQALQPSVVLDAGWPAQVVVDRPQPKMAADHAWRRAQPVPAAPTASVAAVAATLRQEPPRELLLWPRLDAPDVASAGQVFEVVVGFALERQPGVVGGQARLPVEQGQEWLDVTVELTASEAVEAPQGWQRRLRVEVADPAAARASFTLVGRAPANAEQIALTMLEVRYVMHGTVCGTAMRPLAIVAAGRPPGPASGPGAAWNEQPAQAAPVQLQPDPVAPDLTLEILKPDRDATRGSFVCRLCSPHPIATAAGPFELSLGGDDARTFARQLVDDLRVAANGPLLDATLESVGRLVADRLPAEFLQALHEVAALVAPQPPSVLIVSAEPYVPWELAWMDPPLDGARPAYLGAQANVGRWLREPSRPAPSPKNVQRPPVHPRAELGVKNMAVMAAWYSVEGGMRRLPKAEHEAQVLEKKHAAVLLKARADAMQQLLQGRLPGRAGSIDAVHFAGHGNFDAARPDGSTLYLEDGAPVQSLLFRSARYGGELQPLMFLNACMGGVGGDVLGDMGGFPGHSLRGGFGGVVGALWEIDDGVAHDIALDFWDRALPAAAQAGQEVGAILRELRGRYRSDAPVPTYLAYVYYGHPRLKLQRLQ